MLMLVLSRHEEEQVVITTPEGREVVVTVCELRPGKVRLGFHADADVTVHRREVAERIEREGRRA
jgi:carbon storage regulator